jgi:large subunit ribosomal protein L3
MASLRVAPRAAAPAGRSAATVVARAGKPGVGVLGKKAGMTQVFTDDGLAVPATVISVADGNIVTAVRTEETSGYNAVQVGYGVVPERKLTKPEAGHLKAAGTPPMRHLVEFKASLQ